MRMNWIWQLVKYVVAFTYGGPTVAPGRVLCYSVQELVIQVLSPHPSAVTVSAASVSYLSSFLFVS